MGEFSKFMYNQCNYITMVEKDNNIEKSYTLNIYESDKEYKRMYQAASPEEQAKMGYDVPHHADMEDIRLTEMANEWLRDGNPVD